MSSQAPLVPTLYALLPSASYNRLTSHLSLLALHVERYSIRDELYENTEPVIAGQQRYLRFRARRRTRNHQSHENNQEKGRWKGKEKEMKVGNGDGAIGVDGSSGSEGMKEFGTAVTNGMDSTDTMDEAYSLAYLSQPLSGREYGEMNVRAVVNVDVVGTSTRSDIEEFVQTLGCRHSHGNARDGLLFYISLPYPNMTLHLTITRLSFAPSTNSRQSFDTRETEKVENPEAGDPKAANDEKEEITEVNANGEEVDHAGRPVQGSKESEKGDGGHVGENGGQGADRGDRVQARNIHAQVSDEPWLIQLQPSRPVSVVPTRGEPSLNDMMGVMKDLADRIDGVDWGTGR